MSAFEDTSIAPPNWTPAAAPALPSRETAAPERAGQELADAAVRWRFAAAFIDNLLVYASYLLLCAILHWRVADLRHVPVCIGIGLLYYFALESRDGQTIGKRSYGVKVVAADGGPATARAIAIRSLLRLIDQLPVWYASGLISMIRTGPSRRQRIGDVVARTKVVAVAGRGLTRGTPGWYLPAATIWAVFLSAGFVFAEAHSGDQQLTSTQATEWVAGCERGASGGNVDCGCLLSQLEGNGYNTVNKLRDLDVESEAELARGQMGSARTSMRTAFFACQRRATPLGAPGSAPGSGGPSGLS